MEPAEVSRGGFWIPYGRRVYVYPLQRRRMAWDRGGIVGGDRFDLYGNGSDKRTRFDD